MIVYKHVRIHLFSLTQIVRPGKFYAYTALYAPFMTSYGIASSKAPNTKYLPEKTL